MKKLLLVLAGIAFGICSKNLYSQYANLENLSTPPLFGASPFQDSLWAWDTTNFQVVYRVAPTPSSGGAITGINGLTVHPCSGEIFVICKQSAVSGRTLGKFDPQTGVVTILGNLGDNFSSITFREDGQLIGVTGDGASVPETLYLIDENTAAVTLAMALGNGADGEIIAYNKDDDMIYHWSGNGTVIFEKFSAYAPFTYTPVNIPTSGTVGGETFGAVYLGGDEFLISNISSNFKKLTTAGAYGNNLSNNPDDIRGLGLVNRWLVRNGMDTICANDSSMMTAMGGQAYQWTRNGTPVAGATGPVFYARQSGWYNCLIATDTVNCGAPSASDTAWFGKKLVVLNVPVVTLTPSPTAYICSPGDSVLLTGSSGGSSQWYMNGAAISGANTNTFYASAPGLYNMTKTNLNGCSDSSATPVNVMLVPTGLTITPSGTDVQCSPYSAIIVASTGATGYQWLQNGAAISGATNDSLTANATGVYSCIISYGSCADTTGATFDLSVIDCSGIDQISVANVTVYPNPTSDFMVIKTNYTGKWTASLADLTGKVIATYTSSADQLSVSLHKFQNGIYLLKTSDGNTEKVTRIIKY